MRQLDKDHYELAIILAVRARNFIGDVKWAMRRFDAKGIPELDVAEEKMHKFIGKLMRERDDFLDVPQARYDETDDIDADSGEAK